MDQSRPDQVRPIVRPIVRADCAEIWRLIQLLAEFEQLTHALDGSPQSVERWLFDEPVASGFVAIVQGRIVGYALAMPLLATFRMRPAMWLEDLFVEEPHRNRGIGKALILAVIDSARVKGYARVDWSVLDWNSSAIHFYQSLGANLLEEWRLCRFEL